MKPIFFPFTYIDQQTLEALYTCFGKIVVYQPSDAHVPAALMRYKEQGKIDIVLPVNDEQGKLEAVLKNYDSWVKLHGADSASLYRFQTENQANADFSPTSQIRNEIKKKRDNNALPLKNTELLLQARIFLCFAQEMDLQNEGIDRDLSIINEMEKQVLDTLRGETEGMPEKRIPGTAYDPGIYMPEERLSAWSRFFLHSIQQENI